MNFGFEVLPDTSPPIGQAFACNAAQRFDCTLIIGQGAVRIPEIKFVQVALQVLFAAVVIHAAHTALEDAKEAFDGVGGDVATDVFVRGVVN